MLAGCSWSRNLVLVSVHPVLSQQINILYHYILHTIFTLSNCILPNIPEILRVLMPIFSLRILVTKIWLNTEYKTWALTLVFQPNHILKSKRPALKTQDVRTGVLTSVVWETEAQSQPCQKRTLHFSANFIQLHFLLFCLGFFLEASYSTTLLPLNSPI